jgi:hypothetical protein
VLVQDEPQERSEIEPPGTRADKESPNDRNLGRLGMFEEEAELRGSPKDDDSGKLP